jgi:hypothetical protein
MREILITEANFAPIPPARWWGIKRDRARQSGAVVAAFITRGPGREGHEGRPMASLIRCRTRLVAIQPELAT